MTKLTNTEIATKWAALRAGRQAHYIGGGRIMVKNMNTPSCCVYYITTTQARAALSKSV